MKKLKRLSKRIDKLREKLFDLQNKYDECLSVISNESRDVIKRITAKSLCNLILGKYASYSGKEVAQEIAILYDLSLHE